MDLFSTFIRFTGDRFDRWMSDPRLVKSLQQQHSLTDSPTDSPTAEGTWVLYWYQQWQQQHPQAAAHLCAYLQEPCYWAAERVLSRFARAYCGLPDGFQMAIGRLNRILKCYSPTYGSSLRTYARRAFGNYIRDRLRQQQAVNICSDWGLLRKLSRTQLKEALLAAGHCQIHSFVLSWKCFQAVYIPNPDSTARSLPSPSPQQFAQMAKRYNQLRTQLRPVPPSIDAQTLVTKLQQSADAVRAYLTPTITSLTQKEEASEPLSAAISDTPMDLLVAAEAYAQQQHQQQQLAQVLIAAIARLDPGSQQLLQLYYQQALTQKDIAEKLQIQQYQVSRQLAKLRKILLLSVSKWSQETLHISPDSTVLANASDAIHEWLEHHYQPPKASHRNQYLQISR